MTTLSIPLPESAFSALHLDPEAFAREMRIAAAIQWYAQARVSQDKAAEIAGLSRAAFIEALSAARVSPFQVNGESLREELSDAD
jgi:predicted HTH domain antitoxin